MELGAHDRQTDAQAYQSKLAPHRTEVSSLISYMDVCP